MKDWLVMLFLGGDNSIFQYGKLLLKEAESVGSNGRVTVVAEVDPVPQNRKSFRGKLVRGGSDFTNIGVGGNDAGAIIRFVDDSKAKFDARHRALILWDHGDGWQNVHAFANVKEVIDIARGEARPESSLFINDLREVLDEERDIAIIGFDSCLMAMIEIAFQLRDTAQFMVASQHVIPADRGWPYEAFLRSLTLYPNMAPEAVVCALVDGFAGSYNASRIPVTLSALRLSTEVDRTVAAIDSYARVLLRLLKTDPSAKEKVLKARRYTQSFANPDYIDIISFTYAIEKTFGRRDPATSANKPPKDDAAGKPSERRNLFARLDRAGELVRRAVRSLVVRHTRSAAESISYANGVSIYFPDHDIAPSYLGLDFAKREYCSWKPFLEAILSQETWAGKRIARAKSLPEPRTSLRAELWNPSEIATRSSSAPSADAADGSREKRRVSSALKAIPSTSPAPATSTSSNRRTVAPARPGIRAKR